MEIKADELTEMLLDEKALNRSVIGSINEFDTAPAHYFELFVAVPDLLSRPCCCSQSPKR